jgi:TonB family protein
VISASGALLSAKIIQSSGNNQLDDLALGAVQRAAFAAPPPGITLTQLIFVMPYHFR